MGYDPTTGAFSVQDDEQPRPPLLSGFRRPSAGQRYLRDQERQRNEATTPNAMDPIRTGGGSEGFVSPQSDWQNDWVKRMMGEATARGPLEIKGRKIRATKGQQGTTYKLHGKDVSEAEADAYHRGQLAKMSPERREMIRQSMLGRDTQTPEGNAETIAYRRQQMGGAGKISSGTGSPGNGLSSTGSSSPVSGGGQQSTPVQRGAQASGEPAPGLANAIRQSTADARKTAPTARKNAQVQVVAGPGQGKSATYGATGNTYSTATPITGQADKTKPAVEGQAEGQVDAIEAQWKSAKPLTTIADVRNASDWNQAVRKSDTAADSPTSQASAQPVGKNGRTVSDIMVDDSGSEAISAAKAASTVAQGAIDQADEFKKGFSSTLADRRKTARR